MSEYTLPPIKISELSEIVSLRNDDIFVINEQDSFTTKIKWIDVINDLTSRNLVFSGNVVFLNDVKVPALDNRYLFRDQQDNVSQLINDVGYITTAALEGYLKVGDNVGLLTNDVGYITKFEYENGGIVDPNTLYKGDNISELNNDVGYITGIEKLDDIGDVNVTGVTNGQVLQYGNGSWKAVEIPIIADVLKFQGVIDAVSSSPNLGALTIGIYYIHRGNTGPAHPNWTGLGGTEIREGDRLIFARDGRWYQLGNVNDGHEHIELRDLDAVTSNSPYTSPTKKGGTLTYNNTTGVFTLRPADLSDFPNFTELNNILAGKNPDGTGNSSNRYLKAGQVDKTSELINDGQLNGAGPFLDKKSAIDLIDGSDPTGTRFLKANKVDSTHELINTGPNENGGIRDIYITQAETYAILGIDPDTGLPTDPTSPRYLRSNKTDNTSELINDGHTLGAGDKFITEGETFTLLGLDANGNPDPNTPTTYLRRGKQDSTGELVNEGNTVGGTDPFITKGETYNLLGLDANGNIDPNATSKFLRFNQKDNVSELINDANYLDEAGVNTILNGGGTSGAQFVKYGDNTSVLTNNGDGTKPYLTTHGNNKDLTNGAGYLTSVDVDNILNPNNGDRYIKVNDDNTLLTNAAGFITSADVDNILNPNGGNAYLKVGDDISLLKNNVPYLEKADAESIVNNILNTDGYLTLSDLSVVTDNAQGGGALSYTNGVFTFKPADLSSYLTSGDISNYNYITKGDLSANNGTASNGGSLSYNSSNGQFTLAPTSQSWVRGSISMDTNGNASGGGSVTYNNGTGKIKYTPPKLDGFLSNNIADYTDL